MPPATRDPGMHQTQKGRQWYFGMKGHFGVDSQSKLIHSVEVTPANIYDSRVLPWLLHGGERRVWGDSAYAGQGAVLSVGAPYARAGRRKSQAGDKALLGDGRPHRSPARLKALPGTRKIAPEPWSGDGGIQDEPAPRPDASGVARLFGGRRLIYQAMGIVSTNAVYVSSPRLQRHPRHKLRRGRSSSLSPAATGEVVRAAGRRGAGGLADRGAPVNYRRSGRARGRLRRRSGGASW
jgi:DDE family transposase